MTIGTIDLASILKAQGTAMAAELGAPMLTLGGTFVSSLVAYDFIMGKLGNNVIVYLGIVTVLLVQLCSAAYIAYKTTEAVISFVDGFAFIYRRGSIIANYMGQFELSFVVLYYGTAVAVTVLAFYGAMHFWDMVEERDKGAATEGFLGASVSVLDLLHFMMLGLVVMAVTYYSAYSIGETVDQLIGWFDGWSADDQRKFREAINQETSAKDLDGTSLLNDVQYHGVTAIYSWAVFTWLILGADIFAYMYLGFKRVEDCNLDDVQESYYEPVRTLIASQVDLASCKKAVLSIFRLADIDGSHNITRCENAKFLYGMGNTSEYALTFSEIKTLPQLYASCEKRFPTMKKPELPPKSSHGH